MRRRSFRLASLCGAIATAAALAGATALWAADPFYEGMLAEGREALARGEHESALLELEIAAFGLLEDPSLLTDALTHLAIAQVEAGRERELEATLERLLEVESRFGSYRQAEISPAVRQRFEELLANRIALSRLERFEAFRPLARQRELETLMRMRPGERRSLLEGRLELDPNDFRALQLLAEVELEDGRPGAALGYLDRLLELGGDDPILVCRRFRAAAQAGECALAVPDLERCAEVSREAEVAEPILDCLADGDPADALAFLETLSPSLRRTSKFRKTEKGLERRQKELARLAPPPAEAESGDGEEAAATDPAGTSEGIDPIGSEAEQRADTDPRESDRTTADREGLDADRSGGSPSAPSDAALEPPSTDIDAEIDPCAALRAAALGKRCDEALAKRVECPTVAREPAVAERLGKCLAEADRWTELQTFVADLPPQVAGRPKLRKLARRADKRAPDPMDEPVAERGPTDQPPTEVGGAEGVTTPPGGADSPPAAATPSAEPDAQSLAEARSQLTGARTADDLDHALRSTVQLARRYPNSNEAQLLAAEATYRAALWEEAIHFFEAAGDPGDDRPLLLFYRAVSLYEAGRANAALPYLERSLPKLRKTPFVESYAERIRGAARP